MTMSATITSLVQNITTTRWGWAIGGAVPAPLIGPTVSVISGTSTLGLIFNGPGPLKLQPLRGEDTSVPTQQGDLPPITLAPLTPYFFVLYPDEWATSANPSNLVAPPPAVPCDPSGRPLQACTAASANGVSVALPYQLGRGCVQGNTYQGIADAASWTAAIMLRVGVYTPGSYAFELVSPA